MKFQSFNKTVIATLVFGVLSAHAVAEGGKDNKPKASNGQVTAGGTSFLDGKEEGWFWKKMPPEPPKEIEPVFCTTKLGHFSEGVFIRHRR
ncbi:hypothetical protein AB7W42_21225 [Providencia rettgeri]